MIQKKSVYSVSILDKHGRLSLQHIEAKNEEQAARLGCAGGATVIRCDLVQSSRLFSWLPTAFQHFKSSSAIDTVVFSQDMATLMDAGVTVMGAISALNRTETSPVRLEMFSEISASISQGLSFSEALKNTNAFPAVLIATIAASEEAGDLGIGLSRYAKHQQSMQTVRDRVIGACVYPLLLLIVGSLVVALLLGVVVPRFATLIDSAGKELPLFSRILMSWGHVVGLYPWIPFVVLTAMLGAMAVLFVQLKRPENRKKLLDRIPGIAKVVREFQYLQMYRTTAILTSRGIAIHKALAYSIEFLNPADQARLNGALVSMRQGVAVSDALSSSGLSDGVAVTMLNVAERTGAMSEMLDRIADYYERTLQRNIDIVSRLIEPSMMIILGFVIGGIVVLMYLPIFDLASSIS